MPGQNTSFDTAPAVSAPAPVTAAPDNLATTPAPSAPPVMPDTSGESDLAAALRRSMMERFGDGKAPVSNDLPAGLVGGQAPETEQPAPDAAEQIKAAAGEGQAEQQTEQEPEQTDADEAEQAKAREDGREEITAIHLTKFGRDFSLAEVEAAIEGFNYYHPKVLKFQEDVQRLQVERQELEQLRQSPEMLLTGLLKSDPVLKAKFQQIAREHNPGAFQSHEDNQQITALKSEIEQLKGLVSQTQQNEQQRQEQIQQAARQRQFMDTTRAIDQATDAKRADLKANGVEISEQEIEWISQNAVAMVQAGKLRYDPQTMVGYFNHMFDLIANKALAARQQSIQGYRDTKQALPPAPPSGGAAPVIAPDSPQSFSDMEKLLANRIESALKQL